MIMALTRLPTELLEQIITCTLPEGFEGLALSCKGLYAICIPFLKHHSNLRWQFRDFRYCKTKRSFRTNRQLLGFPDTATSAYNLISRIAIEPVVGRHILEADFTGDSHLYSRFASPHREETTYEDRDEAVRRLFANSSYLEEAGIDWEQYYGAMMEDINNCCYSQHAAAFVLTLLPNLRRFRLPQLWSSTPETEKLIGTVIRITRQPTNNTASLARVAEFEETRGRYELSWATTLIALPHIQSFQGRGCTGKAYDDLSIASRCLCSDFDSMVEKVGFWEASIDAVAIADFLKHTPRLKSLTYWHSTKHNMNNPSWDLCGFLSAVQQKAGGHLESLSAITTELLCSISPGKPCLRRFQHLQCLELPLEIVICGFTATELANLKSLGVGSLLGDLLPASVSQLSLFSPGKSPHDKALDLLFHDFAAQKQLQTPNLTVIRLTCPDDADELYKAECRKLMVEAERAGVALEITETPTPISTVGLDDDEYFLEFS